jgi:hypothetical protein
MTYMVKTGALPRDVGVHHVTIYHDDWCGHWQQRCNCDPDMQLKVSLAGRNNEERVSFG